MPQFVPEAIDDQDELYERTNRLSNFLASFDFPGGSDSEIKRILNGVYALYRQNVETPPDLFIPNERDEAILQCNKIQAELELIKQREKDMTSSLFQIVELGSKLSQINSSYLFDEEAEQDINNYIAELKRIHDL